MLPVKILCMKVVHNPLEANKLLLVLTAIDDSIDIFAFPRVFYSYPWKAYTWLVVPCVLVVFLIR